MQKSIVFILFLFWVNVPLCEAQWSYTTLSEAKNASAVAVINNKIFFHCGTKKIGSSQVDVNTVDVFDVFTDTRQTFTLPTTAARGVATSAVVGTKVIFAGGDNGDASNKVDIYDTLTGLWSIATLSLDRSQLAGASANGKAFFGGGFSSTISNETNKVDVYNASTGLWSNTADFPLANGANLTAASLGNKVFFAGGDHANATFFNTVNIYDASTNQWLPGTTLSQYKNKLSSLVYKNKIYFIGGMAKKGSTRYPSDTIDIYDGISNSWTILKIPRLMHTNVAFQNPTLKRIYQFSAQAGCKMFLVPTANTGTNGTADTIAVYDFARNSWSYMALPNPRSMVTIAAAKNKVYFAGGAGVTPATNGIWYNHVDIFTLSPILQSTVNNTTTTEHTFGTVVYEEEENIDLKLSNEGDYDLYFAATKINITGDVSDFTVDYSALPDTLEPADTISLPISFSPTAEGERSITITLYSSDPAHPSYTFTVKGTGHIPVPDLQTSVNSTVLTEYDFGTILTGNQESITLQVSNEGDNDLLFTTGSGKITVDGDLSDFTIDYSALPDLLAATENATLSITFTPATEGAKQVTLSFHSNDPDSQVYIFTINGIGDTPTGTLNANAASTVQVYPNPTSGMITLKSNSSETFRLQVVNGQGVIVKTGEFTSTTNLDLSSFPEGLYSLKIEGEQSNKVLKIIKK